MGEVAQGQVRHFSGFFGHPLLIIIPPFLHPHPFITATALTAARHNPGPRYVSGKGTPVITRHNVLQPKNEIS